MRAGVEMKLVYEKCFNAYKTNVYWSTATPREWRQPGNDLRNSVIPTFNGAVAGSRKSFHPIYEAKRCNEGVICWVREC